MNTGEPEPSLSAPQEQALLRIFVDKYETAGHRPLYEVIVERARRRGLAGATVFEGMAGYGLRGILHRARSWKPGDDEEMIVEIVDRRPRLDAFLAEIEPLLSEAVVTFERACVVVQRHRRERHG